MSWHEGDANLHWFLSSPFAGKVPNDVDSQKVTENPKERSRMGRDISKVYMKNCKVGDPSVILWAFCLVMYSIAEAETSCLRCGGEKIGSGGGRVWYAAEWWSQTLLPFYTKNVRAYYLSFSPLYSQTRFIVICFLTCPDHFWSVFNKILVQILAFCGSLTTKIEDPEAEIFWLPIRFSYRRLKVQPMSLSSLSWWHFLGLLHLFSSLEMHRWKNLSGEF